MNAIAWLIVRLRWPIVLAWLVAAIAAIAYLPSLQEAGDQTELLGLVPENAEAIAAGACGAAELFSVPVITHTPVVQREPGRPLRCRAARGSPAGRSGSRTRQDPELREIRFALPLVNARGLVPGSRESGTTAITYLFFDPTKTDLDDQDELTRAASPRSTCASRTTTSSASPARFRRGSRSGGRSRRACPGSRSRRSR